jgi:AcrR family transcriptional regulator
MAPPRSNRRKKQAAATREDILAAARRLFATKGYAATSMSAIAAEAETAVQTIYDSVGPKHAIILAMVGMLEEEAGVGEVQRRLTQAQEPRELVDLFVGFTRWFTEHGADIVRAMASAAPSEPDVAAALQKANENHHGGAGYVARRLAEMDALKPGISPERATDVIGALTWGPMWRQLTGERGWSLDECETWMVESIQALLLRDAAG